MRLFSILFIIFFSTNAFTQIIITGKVYDQTNKAIPGSSVYIKNSYLGTVTNSNGDFKIRIPKKYQSHKLCISCIGYQKEEKDLDQIKSLLNIQLQKDTTNLDEVLVMPKDTLLALLRRAYGKIKDNYPDVDTRMKGFYREAYYIPEKHEYLYFGEAQLDIFKTSYKNNTEGQVKIIDSRMNKHPLYSSLSTVMWYGGVQLPISFDEVKIRGSFISPKNFEKYNYSILSTKLEGNLVYKVNFTPKGSQKGKYKGAFYLEKESLAYVFFEYIYTDYGKKKRSNYLAINKIQNISRKFIVKYRKVNGVYFLSYISDFEKLYNEKIKQELIQFNEYITTDVDTENVKTIPFEEQTELRDVFYLKAKNYNESDWMDQTTIVPDSSLNKLMEYSQQEANQLLNKKHNLPKGFEFKKKLVEIITKMYFDVDFETRSASGIASANFLYTPTPNHNFSKNFGESKNQSYSYGLKMGYKLNRKFDINYYAAESIGKRLSEKQSFGLSYETPIINRGRQLLLMCGMNYFSANNGYHVGDFKSESTFKADGKKIRADKIALFVGKKKQGISFDLGLKTKLYRFYSLFVTGGYQLNFSERDRLFIHEKSGFFLTRRKTDISLDDSSINYFENGMKTLKTNFDTDEFYLKAGIRFSL